MATLHVIQHTDRNLSWWRTPGIRSTVSGFAFTGDRGVPVVRSLYIEVQPGLSREIPAWMCDAAVCATIISGSPRIAVDALTEIRAVLDTSSAGCPCDGSLTSSTAKEGPDETSLPSSTRPRSRSRRKNPPAVNRAGGAVDGVSRSASRTSAAQPSARASSRGAPARPPAIRSRWPDGTSCCATITPATSAGNSTRRTRS